MLIPLSIIAFVLGCIISFLNAPKISEQIQRTFTYTWKGSVTTPTELIFYRRLLIITKGNYAIVPQAHLSSFLNEKTKVELDGYTHKRYKRV